MLRANILNEYLCTKIRKKFSFTLWNIIINSIDQYFSFLGYIDYLININTHLHLERNSIIFKRNIPSGRIKMLKEKGSSLFAKNLFTFGPSISIFGILLNRRFYSFFLKLKHTSITKPLIRPGSINIPSAL